MHHSLMHPCSNADSQCCGNSRSAPFLLRYESFFHSQNALLVLAYEVGGMLLANSLPPGHPCPKLIGSSFSLVASHARLEVISSAMLPL